MDRRNFIKYSTLGSLAVVLPVNLLNASANQAAPDFYVYIDETENFCTECGSCVAICDSVFNIDRSIAEVKNTCGEPNRVNGRLRDCVQEAADSCPVGVIVISDVKRK